MKKLIAILLCVVIICSLCLTVFANDGEGDKVPSPTTPTVAPTEEPTEPESPATGSVTNNWGIALVVLLGIGGCCIASKKLLKNN